MSNLSQVEAVATDGAVRIFEAAADIDHLALEVAQREPPRIGPGECLIEVVAAGVNPSDVKATLGLMPHAIWPRTPGRDYGGIVRDGPSDLVGLEVWGGGGELGIRRDGTHARWLVLNEGAVREKPSTLSLEEAGTIGVPFITAFEGLREAGGVKEGEVVLVLGGNGKVGQAAIQIATMRGAQVFAVEHRPQPFVGHACAPVEMIDASATDFAAFVRDKTDGHGADIVYNTVGSPFFEKANEAMAVRGRQIFISTFERSVPFDIFAFYRGRHKFIGIDTLALDSHDGAEILDQLKPGFEDGRLRPFPIAAEARFTLADAAAAYRTVLGGSPYRVLLKP